MNGLYNKQKQQKTLEDLQSYLEGLLPSRGISRKTKEARRTAEEGVDQLEKPGSCSGTCIASLFKGALVHITVIY